MNLPRTEKELIDLVDISLENAQKYDDLIMSSQKKFLRLMTGTKWKNIEEAQEACNIVNEAFDKFKKETREGE